MLLKLDIVENFLGLIVTIAKEIYFVLTTNINSFKIAD